MEFLQLVMSCKEESILLDFCKSQVEENGLVIRKDHLLIVLSVPDIEVKETPVRSFSQHYFSKSHTL